MTQSITDGIKNNRSSSMRNYSFWMGGLNVKNSALAQYTPQKTGYGRIFLVRMPAFLAKMVPERTKNFKHMIEYGFTNLSGLGNTTLNFEQMTGGYVGRQMDVASVAQDETNEVTLQVYESTGSPIREYLDLWVNGISDQNTGIAHYQGAIQQGMSYRQSNHTMEAIYVSTDPTGRSDGIEYACMLANMMPKQVRKDQFNYESGQHQNVQLDIPFSCVKYESIQINTIAKALVAKYAVLRNYIDYQPGYSIDDINGMPADTLVDWKNE